MHIVNTLSRIICELGLLGCFEIFAALLVAIGCSGELWIILNKLTRHVEPLAKNPGVFWAILNWIDMAARPIAVRLKLKGRKLSEAKENLLERLFVMLVALGVGLEVIALMFSLHEFAKLNEKAGVAMERAAIADERSKQLESTNLGLLSQIEGLKLDVAKANELAEKEARARVELESDVAVTMSPRILVQTGAAAGRLAQFSNVTAIIHIIASDPMDAEPFRAASQIFDFLRRSAHWNPIFTNIPSEWAWPPRKAGVEVQVNKRASLIGKPSELDLQAMRAGDALAKELNAGGIEAEASMSRMKLPPGMVLIVVGDRRNPFEYRFLEQTLERRASVLEQSDPAEAKGLRRLVESLKTADRLKHPNPELMLLHEKETQLRDEEQKLSSRISELRAKQFPPASKELAEAQAEFNALNARLSELWNEESVLRDQIWQGRLGTNSVRSPR